MSRARTSRQDPRRQQVPVETSWRIVEGEHDSFDTSIIPDELLDDDNILSSGPSQLSNLSQLSQLSSQSNGDWRIGGSQDNSTIHDFIDRADEEEVIKRSPFGPSVPTASRRLPRTQNMKDRSPDPEFYMPMVDVDNPRRGSPTGSSRTIRPVDGQILRQRLGGNGHNVPPDSLFAAKSQQGGRVQQRRATRPDVRPTFVSTLYDILAWFLGLIGMTARYTQKPLAVGLALYLTFGMLIFAGNWARHTFYTAISPICNIPGLTHVVDLPFCDIGPGSSKHSASNLEFNGLMDIQENLEDVAEKAANGVSLPMQMKRSETSIRDLKTLVSYSKLQNKDDLVDLFNEYIITARTASGDLQKFNVHVGSAVDSVISINRWTSRYLDGLVSEQNQGKGLLGDLTTWLFSPFQPDSFSEQRLLDTYIKHAGMVSDKIAHLIIEAQDVLHTLERTDDHLSSIHDFVVRTQDSIQVKKDDTLWTLWTVIGGNRHQVHNLDAQLRLLRLVGTQRSDAVRLVMDLKEDLENIQHQLDDLRQRVSEPELATVAGAPGSIPLGAHIDRINMGVDRLEVAKKRIRSIEDDKIREVLARGKEEERMIEAS